MKLRIAALWFASVALIAGACAPPSGPGPMVRTMAGSAGVTGSADGAGAEARFRFPNGVAVDRSGNVYAADTGNHTIRKVTPAGTVTTLAGTAGATGSADGTGAAARFYQPVGVAVDESGYVYVADTANHTIRKVSPTGEVTTVAGAAGIFGSADGTGTSARFDGPTGVAVDGSGNLFVADSFNRTIRKVTPTGVVTTVAGTARALGLVDGIGAAARFGFPAGVAVDGLGNLWVTDSYNNVIRKVSAGGAVTTLPGQEGISFNYPFGIAVDRFGSVYVADAENSRIRRITPEGLITNFAGTGAMGSTDGAPATASFHRPFGVAVDPSGRVYVADSENNTIRTIG